MRKFLEDTPPVLWTALIVGLLALADWLSSYFGGVAWILPVVGFITVFLVPVIRVIIPVTPTSAERAVGEVQVEPSRAKRWLI